MVHKIIVGIAAVIVIAAAGGAGWWISAERGWIAGKENSPRPENFKRAVDDYLQRTGNWQSRQCASVGYHPGQRQGSHPDTAFDWTPAGFLARTDGETARMQNLARRLPLLEKHGLLQSRKGEGGAQEYTLTWKGYAASNGSGCFFLTSGEREAKVLATEKARVENGVEIYEVVARPLPKAVEPWAADPGFKDAFEGQNFRTQLEPEPVTYELARGATAFTVIGEKGKPTQQRQTTAADPAVLARMAGQLTPERVKEALDAHLQKGAVRNQACVEMPAQGEADESNVYNYYSQPGVAPPPITVTFYNLIERRDYALANTLRGYETMRRLESLGMAKSELLGVAEWQGRLASGAVRYELTAEALGKLVRGNPRCLPVGTLVPEAVVSVQQFTELQPRPRFVARARLKADGEAKALVEKFGHFARMAEPGAAMQGTLRYQEGQLQVENLQVMQPRFFPDTSQVRLPIVEAPAPQAIGKGGKPGAVIALAPAGPVRDTVFAQVMGMSALSNGGLTMTYCCAGASTPAYSSVAQTNGRWYAEMTLRLRPGGGSPDTWTNVQVLPQPRAGGGSELFMAAASGQGAIGRGQQQRFREGDVIGVAVDADAGRVWYSLNGNWINGTPGAGGGNLLARGQPLVVVVTSSASSEGGQGAKDAWTANFGKTRFRTAIPRGFRSWDGRQSG